MSDNDFLIKCSSSYSLLTSTAYPHYARAAHLSGRIHKQMNLHGCLIIVAQDIRNVTKEILLGSSSYLHQQLKAEESHQDRYKVRRRETLKAIQKITARSKANALLFRQYSPYFLCWGGMNNEFKLTFCSRTDPE